MKCASLVTAFLLAACGGPSAPAPKSSEPLSEVQPDQIELTFGEKGEPTNYLTAPEDAQDLGGEAKYVFVGTRASTGASPESGDVAVAKLKVWDADGNLRLGESNESFPIPMIGQEPPLEEVLSAMRPGDMVRMWIADQSGGVVIGDLQLVSMLKAPKPPELTVPTDASQNAEGLHSAVVHAGTGDTPPDPHDEVVFEHITWNADGSLEGWSQWLGEPATAVAGEVKELREALLEMVTGETRRMWVSADKSGERGRPMVVEVKLLEIIERPAPPPVPENLESPPKNAKRTKSGLRYLVVGAEATSKAKPKADSTVEVHYTGWTTDGTMFDSSVVRNQTAIMPLTALIPGWKEGLPLMREGQTFRFWIPSTLAYDGAPGKPEGMLVFDVKLIRVVEDNESDDPPSAQDAPPSAE